MKRFWMLIVLLRCVIPEGSTPREIRGGGGAHVPRLNFTASYVAISEHSHVTCGNVINNFFSLLPV